MRSRPHLRKQAQLAKGHSGRSCSTERCRSSEGPREGQRQHSPHHPPAFRICMFSDSERQPTIKQLACLWIAAPRTIKSSIL